jgi:hypothetical protein
VPWNTSECGDTGERTGGQKYEDEQKPRSHLASRHATGQFVRPGRIKSRTQGREAGLRPWPIAASSTWNAHNPRYVNSSGKRTARPAATGVRACSPSDRASNTSTNAAPLSANVGVTR